MKEHLKKESKKKIKLKVKNQFQVFDRIMGNIHSFVPNADVLVANIGKLQNVKRKFSKYIQGSVKQTV